MNPRRIADFLKSKFGLFVIFVVILFSGLWIYGNHQANEHQAQKLAAQHQKNIELGQVRLPLDQGLADGMPQHSSKEVGKNTAGEIVPFKPGTLATPVARSNAASDSKISARPRKVRFASLLASYEAPSAKPQQKVLPERFIPFGTLLKCKLVNTIDSANLETPVIALLLEDVWQNGKKIVPANTLIHGTAKAGRIRDRVNASGTWRFVWQDGRELAFAGVALDREYDHDINGYGITDGSGGIRGRIIATDDLQDLKVLAAAALSGFARGTQDRSETALGTTLTGSVSNGVREGVGSVFDLYAKRTLQDVQDNGYYVRVAAGKEFYVYVLEAIDPGKAVVAGVMSRPPLGTDHDSTNLYFN
jgi:hypothetical protein